MVFGDEPVIFIEVRPAVDIVKKRCPKDRPQTMNFTNL